jgi:hypothetical protein
MFAAVQYMLLVWCRQVLMCGIVFFRTHVVLPALDTRLRRLSTACAYTFNTLNYSTASKSVVYTYQHPTTSCCVSVLPFNTLLQALVSNNVSLSLRSAVALAAAQQPLAVSQQQQEAVVEFVSRRLEQLLVDSGVSAEAGMMLSCKPCCVPASLPLLACKP